ncbi:MAG: bifunctional diguanylate cyclase/phosphodiesterase [Bauldia sp.]|uniref:putative bifunctional diguanylate cyclase/phosphodiesterase n=1 Tax=Bauldia sp. TaxID=2575872 RepID=UPI001D735FD9|nr:bifunctional diguanylate cyclase/phosphodiesterase [Bauldia sp.]MCB1494195.1 bifunctional diguanylate cyclase/phosphodiesterase [Bauldia sp.]
MPKLESIISRFGIRILLPAVVVLVGALTIVIVSLGEMANEVNRIEDRLTARSAEAAIQVSLRRIGDSHRDYASWDDAVRNLYGRVDEEFLDEGYVSAAIDAVFFDSFYLIDESGRDVVGYHFGERLEESSASVYGDQLAKLIASLPRDGKTYAVKTGILQTKWGLAKVAVGPVVPFSEDYSPRPAASRLLLISHAFDGAAVASLGEDYLIEGLRLVDAGAAGPSSVTITDPSGTVLAALDWTSRALGNEARARIGPAVFVMLALICVVMIFLLVVARRSVDAIKQKEAEARHMATHDQLTGLPNRSVAVTTIDEALAKRKGGEGVAAIYVDLDRFKDVDDTFGHETGDRLLVKIAGLFQECAGEHLLARIGGDEFVFVVCDRKAVEAACTIGWKIIDSLAVPFVIDGRVISIAANVGIAVADTIDPSAQELLRRADVAMDQAKSLGSNRFFVYEPFIDTVRHERLELADDLRRALLGDELDLVYQPVFDAETRDVVGVEALLRWERPLFGAVSPEVIIPIAEESGLIDALSQWTLRRACRDARDWQDVWLAVNISTLEFRNPNFDGHVARILAETGLPASRMEIEVIESELLGRPDQIRRTIDAVRGLGVAVALDDFGTGYSSIGYLRSFALDKIKLDRSMVDGITVDEDKLKLLRATVDLAHALNLKVTAEGVESAEEARLLCQVGCRELQGFYLADVMSAARIDDFLAARRDAGSLAHTA